MSPDPLEPMPALSKRQAEVLLFVGQYFARHHEMPSHAEIREQLQLGPQTNVGPYLRPLFERGYLERAGSSVKGRMRLTNSGLDRMEGLIPSEATEYQELERLISLVNKTTHHNTI
ncbi:LexA family protein [Deinococcus sp. PESE-13]